MIKKSNFVQYSYDNLAERPRFRSTGAELFFRTQFSMIEKTLVLTIKKSVFIERKTKMPKLF